MSLRTSMRRCPSSRRYFPGSLVASDNRRLDNAHFTDRRSDLGVFWGVFLTFARDKLERLDFGDGNAQPSPRKPSHTDVAVLRAMSGLRSGLERAARFRGRVSSPSARNSVTKFSSTISFRMASVTKISRFRVVFGLSDQKALAVDVLLIGANSAFEDRGRSRRFPLGSRLFAALSSPLPLFDEPPGSDQLVTA